ncbi:MAG TPA: pitrilysin family protein [Gemmatimonadales bacterium]|nr:pitrilysin family protein [Gemmatimonadales bacterium]
MRTARLAAGLFCALTAPLAAQLPQGVDKGASVEGITEYTLANGLKVLIFPDPGKPTATINITYLVGSRHEGYGESGMAHLLEHMVFKGSPRHSNIPQELTEHGARPNGTTWFDRTNYFETVPASDLNIDWALDLEADRMVNSFIAKKDLESEFSVVRNEFEAGENSPFSVLLERTLSTAFLWHNYGKSTIGARSDIEQVPIERLQAFYHRYYQPDNAILMVAGKIDEAKLIRLINDKFGAIPKPVRSLDRGNMIYPTYTAEPTQDGEREVSLRRTGDLQVAMAMYHVPAGAHPDFAAVDVLGRMLADQPSGRIYKTLVETKKASDAGAFDFQLKEPGVLIGYANVRKEQSLEEAKAGLVQAIESAASEAPTAEEVDRARTALLKNLDLLLSNSERVGLNLSEYMAGGDWRLIFLHRDRLKKVTAQDVQRVAQAYLKPANRTVGLFYPTESPVRAEVPWISDAEIAAMTKDYKGNTALAAGEAFDPSPVNIETRTTRAKLGNGFKLALLPKQTRGQVVTARLTIRQGDEKSLEGLRNVSARLLNDLYLRGSRQHTRQQIQDSLDRLGSRVFVFGAGNNTVVSIETKRPSLAPTLRLVAEVLKEPAFDAKEFELLKQETLASMEESKKEPTVLASLALSRALTPYPKGHPLYTMTVEEQIESYNAVTLENLRKVYGDLVGGSYGDLVAVGDFAKDSIAALAGELFGGWKSPKAFIRLVRTYFDPQPINSKLETPDKANAGFFAGQNLKLRDDSKDYAALALGNYMLGGGFLNSRLATRIRQKEGISYGIGSSLSAQSLDSVGSFQTFAIYAPENVVRLEHAFREEIEKVRQDGFTQQELEAARQGWLQQQLQSRANDASLVGILAAQYITGRTMAYNTQLERWVAELTAADVNAAVRKYLDPAKLSIVKAGDFAKHPPKPAAVMP